MSPLMRLASMAFMKDPSEDVRDSIFTRLKSRVSQRGRVHGPHRTENTVGAIQ
jgi:hypothetical protein